MEDDELDEILGISRCARCGHRLDGEIECPFCSLFPDTPREPGIPKWIYLTACFLTSPLSIPAVMRADRLGRGEKVVAVSGCLFWLGLFRFFL